MRNLITASILALAIAAPAAAADFSLEPEPPDHDEQLLDFTNINRDAVRGLWGDVERLDAGVALSNALGAHTFDPYDTSVQWSLSLGAYAGETGASAALLVPTGDDSALSFAAGRSSADDVGGTLTWSGRW